MVRASKAPIDTCIDIMGTGEGNKISITMKRKLSLYFFLDFEIGFVLKAFATGGRYCRTNETVKRISFPTQESLLATQKSLKRHVYP